MALINVTGEDSWLKEFEHIGSLISEINQATVRRRQLRLGNVEHAKLTSQLRKEIPQAEVQLAGLLVALEDPTNNVCRTIVPGERERRIRLCENLNSNLKKASEEYYRGESSRGPFTKVADLGTVNWGEDETESTRGRTNEELRNQHREVVQAQDAVIESLSVVVGNQRHIAKSIQDEVEDQDDLLIDIRDRTSANQTSLEQQTSNITEATRKSSTWGFWIVIVVLLIAIIIVAIW